MPLSLSVVIPVHNEAPTLQSTILRFEKILSSDREITRYEILLIDDGSTDKSFRNLKPSKTVTILRHAKHLGYGAALKTGIRAAEYALIVMCDADGSYPIEDLPRLLKPWRDNKMIVASRSPHHLPRNRWPQWGVRYALQGWLFFITYRWIKDIHSGFRVFAKSQIEAWLPDMSDRFSFTTEMSLLWALHRYPIIHVTLPYTLRLAPTKAPVFREGWETFKQTARLTMIFQPIRLVAITVAIGFYLMWRGMR